MLTLTKDQIRVEQLLYSEGGFELKPLRVANSRQPYILLIGGLKFKATKNRRVPFWQWKWKQVAD